MVAGSESQIPITSCLEIIEDYLKRAMSPCFFGRLAPCRKGHISPRFDEEFGYMDFGNG